jgi:ankyrin repeat protein
MTSHLPTAANLEHLRKQAKALLRDHRAALPAAVERMRAHPRPPREPKLADAQLVVAREYGFPSWPRLRAYVERVQAHGPGLQHAFEEGIDYYAGRATGLLASARDQTPTALAAFARWSAPLTPAGARAVVAAEHGFTSWAGLRRHVTGLAAGGEPFARAFTAIRAQDVAGLDALLDRFPELVTARGTNGNDLLGLASATCDERLVALLLARGADVAASNAHGWTALHQAAYSDLPLMARVLLDAGAPVDVSARGDGGTPLTAALFWGNTTVARLLAAHGVVPANLRIAAGLDDVALIDQLLPAGGAPTAAAGEGRGFCRPHSGFPAWRPSDDPAEIRDEALSWAARADAVAAIGALVARGADVNANVYQGTPLTWAAVKGRLAAARRLLELGADVNLRGTFGGPQHGSGTIALHHAAEAGHLPMIELLLAAGADRTLRDDLYDGTPASWAAHGEHPEAVALLTR